MYGQEICTFVERENRKCQIHYESQQTFLSESLMFSSQLVPCGFLGRGWKCQAHFMLVKCQHVPRNKSNISRNKSNISSADVGAVLDEEVELLPEDLKVCLMLEELSFFFLQVMFLTCCVWVSPRPINPWELGLWMC